MPDGVEMNELDHFVKLFLDNLDADIRTIEKDTLAAKGFESLIVVSTIASVMRVRNAVVLAHNEVYNSRKKEGK
jgi:hypothetical protein